MKLIATILFILSSIVFSFSQEASDSINRKIDSINLKTGRGKQIHMLLNMILKADILKKIIKELLSIVRLFLKLQTSID